MAQIQKKIFKEGYNSIEFSNIVTSSVKNPHSTMIVVKDRWHKYNFYVARYIDLDTIDTYNYACKFLASIAEEIKSTPAEAQMYQNNKKFNEFIDSELNKQSLANEEPVDWRDLPEWEELKLNE